MTTYFGHRNSNRPDGSTPDAWFPYTCGHCGREVSGAVLALVGDDSGSPKVAVRWLQCSACYSGSVWLASGAVYPGAAFGPRIQGLPPDVEAAYEEARRCFSVNAYTAAEGLCRKILMHVAVDKGSSEGDTFATYISHLEQQGYVTPPMKPWVALIREHGNKAQHELKPPDKQRAEGTLLFTAQLLRSVYEMGYMAGQFVPSPSGKPHGGQP